MIAFFVVVGGLLFAFGGLFMIMSIEPTPLDASWDEVKKAFRVMSGKPRFRVGVGCFVIGCLITFGLMSTLIQ